jgi:molecular chaperone DnaK (HSP70)
MREWKAAGRAQKNVDDKLWTRFRTAQDRFFSARDAVNAEIDKELASNAERKAALLEQAEALLPVRDARSAREAFRAIGERWDATGKVPRSQLKSLESRLRKVDDAIRAAEQDNWRRSNPEARARAEATVAQLESLIENLEQELATARSKENADEIAAAEEALEARRTWLTQARLALDELSPADPP